MNQAYNKLVRDNIPTLIEESGRELKTRILEDREYHNALIDKVIEEIEEFRASDNEEEIADIYEILDCIIKLNGYEPMHIDYLQLVKREARGSYNDRVFLVEVEDLPE